MKKLIYLLVIVFAFGCKNTQKKSQEINVEKEVVKDTQSVPSLNYEQLEPLLNKKDDKIHVVNFWATWCAPCIKELPYFEAIGKEYKDAGVEVLLVSLDFPKQKEKKLLPFIAKHKIDSKVVLLDDVNEQVWIPKISEKWSGALPGTLIYTKDKREFYEQSFTKEELETKINSFIN